MLAMSVILGMLGATAYGVENPSGDSDGRQAYRDVTGMEVHHCPVVVESEAR